MSKKNARITLPSMEIEETKVLALVDELQIGEKSGMLKNFNRNENLEKLHAEYLSR